MVFLFLLLLLVKVQLLRNQVNFEQYQIVYSANGLVTLNTSLAAPGALAHRLQRRTACNT